MAFPTETVYGLGADARNEAAVRRIFAAKERPYDHPLIVHIASLNKLTEWASDIPPAALALASAFWPGPLTLVLKKQPSVLDIVTGGQETIGLRIPQHPLAQALLQAFEGGIAAPSANKFTHISTTTAAAVREELGLDVDMILDGGSCTVGLESTIIDLSGPEPVILRPGMITAEAIAVVLGKPVVTKRQDKPGPRAPGMHHLHYAPTTSSKLVETAALPTFLQSLTPSALPLALLARTQVMSPHAVHVVQMPQEAAAYAHELYYTLRLLDNQQFKQIVIEAVPDGPEWEAIRDRLMKATAAR